MAVIGDSGGAAVVRQFQQIFASRHILYWHTQKRCVKNGKELQGEESSSLESIRLTQIFNNMDVMHGERRMTGFTVIYQQVSITFELKC